MNWQYSNSPDNLPSTPGFYWVQELWTGDDTTWLVPMMWELVMFQGTLRFYDIANSTRVIDMINHEQYEETRMSGPVDHPNFKEPK